MISVEVLSRPRGQRNRRDGAEEPRPGGTAEQVWVLAQTEVDCLHAHGKENKQ